MPEGKEDSIKKDCFAYSKHKCSALNRLYCEKETCPFYKAKEADR